MKNGLLFRCCSIALLVSALAAACVLCFSCPVCELPVHLSTAEPVGDVAMLARLLLDRELNSSRLRWQYCPNHCTALSAP